MAAGIMVITETSETGFRKVTFECLSQGRRLADALGEALIAVVFGKDGDPSAEPLALHGADRILYVPAEQFNPVLTDRTAAMIAVLITRERPSTLLLGATALGKELAARLAAKLDAPVAMDGIAVRAQQDTLIATRPMYGGKILADVALCGTPRIVAIRPNSIPIASAAGRGIVETVPDIVVDSGLVFIEEVTESGTIELTEADIVVSGGRGMGGSDYAVLEELAEALGGAVGASRSAVDEGWRPYSDQVGQTGKVVSPNLYIACGISGAIQHLAGMSSSRVVVAVNTDADAPIFSKADYGIVGDLFEVVPLITREVRKLKNERSLNRG